MIIKHVAIDQLPMDRLSCTDVVDLFLSKKCCITKETINMVWQTCNQQNGTSFAIDCFNCAVGGGNLHCIECAYKMFWAIPSFENDHGMHQIDHSFDAAKDKAKELHANRKCLTCFDSFVTQIIKPINANTNSESKEVEGADDPPALAQHTRCVRGDISLHMNTI